MDGTAGFADADAARYRYYSDHSSEQPIDMAISCSRAGLLRLYASYIYDVALPQWTFRASLELATYDRIYPGGLAIYFPSELVSKFLVQFAVQPDMDCPCDQRHDYPDLPL